MTEIADLVGERLMIGLPGPTLSDADIRLFRDTRAAGLILYRRNFESPEGLAVLLDRLDAALGRRVLVSTDHEGGRIVMLGRGATIFPDNLAVGTAGEEAFAARQGLIEGREMRRLGVDLTLGPCLDVLTDRYSPNIGIRSYGKDPKLVSRYGVARIRGQMRGGLSACPKHFPGKGHSPLDAHLKLPTIDSTPEEMEEIHLPPFREAIAAGVECLMTSHPVYPKLDPSGVPATFSRRLVGDWLRGELRFERRHRLGRSRDGRGQRDLSDRRGRGAHRGRRPRSAARLPHGAGAAGRRRGAGRVPIVSGGCRSTSARRPPSACASSASRARRGARVARPSPSPTAGRWPRRWRPGP